MKKQIKIWINMLKILICGGIFGTLLLGVVYCIPTDKAFSRCHSNGLDMIETRNGWHRYLIDYEASTLDNATEWEMLRIASSHLPGYTGENVFQYAMRGYRILDYNVDEADFKYDTYERYWHGYLLILKPLLHYFSYTDIIFINMAIQILLISGMVHILTKNKMHGLKIIFIFFWILTMQVVIMFSMDYSVCFYIYMLGTFAMLLFDKVQKNYIYLFLIIGMMTSYFDFLTWPIVTLIMPLITFLYIEKRKLISAIMASISWGIGYVVFWAEKWIIGSMILENNIIQDAIDRLKMRSSMDVVGDEVNTLFIDTIKLNFSVFLKKGYLLIIVLAFGGILLVQLYRIYKGAKFEKGKFLNYSILMLLPLGWYMVTTNHSTVHYWMTWRTAATFLIIVFAALVDSVQKERDMKCGTLSKGREIYPSEE